MRPSATSVSEALSYLEGGGAVAERPSESKVKVASAFDDLWKEVISYTPAPRGALVLLLAISLLALLVQTYKYWRTLRGRVKAVAEMWASVKVCQYLYSCTSKTSNLSTLY
jgi:hypothetical protein